LDLSGVDFELALAVADDYGPTAAESRGDRLILYFSSAMNRNRAHQAIARAWPESALTAREVDDEDWARRSQEHLPPVRVGRLAVMSPGAAVEPPADLLLVVQPSTGFGTGHHATTRLCLAGLQTLELAGRFVVDIGTGSGVLAMAARLLGARAAVGIDYDPDAVRAARENLPLNPRLDHVRFEVGDLGSTFDVLRATCAEPRAPFDVPRASNDEREARHERSAPYGERSTGTPDGAQEPSIADVITANLTAWHLANHAGTLLGFLRQGGLLVASGMLTAERDLVIAAFMAGAAAPRIDVVWMEEEEGWAAAVLRKR
jgi:ribosomal protein L11 methylase PrmA